MKGEHHKKCGITKKFVLAFCLISMSTSISSCGVKTVEGSDTLEEELISNINSIDTSKPYDITAELKIDAESNLGIGITEFSNTKLNGGVTSKIDIQRNNEYKHTYGEIETNILGHSRTEEINYYIDFKNKLKYTYDNDENTWKSENTLKNEDVFKLIDIKSSDFSNIELLDSNEDENFKLKAEINYNDAIEKLDIFSTNLLGYLDTENVMKIDAELEFNRETHKLYRISLNYNEHTDILKMSLIITINQLDGTVDILLPVEVLENNNTEAENTIDESFGGYDEDAQFSVDTEEINTETTWNEVEASWTGENKTKVNETQGILNELAITYDDLDILKLCKEQKIKLNTFKSRGWELSYVSGADEIPYIQMVSVNGAIGANDGNSLYLYTENPIEADDKINKALKSLKEIQFTYTKSADNKPQNIRVNDISFGVSSQELIEKLGEPKSNTTIGKASESTFEYTYYFENSQVIFEGNTEDGVISIRYII